METQLECRLTPDDWRDAVEQGREQGRRDERAAAVARVEALDEAVPFSSDVDTLLSLSEVLDAIRAAE